MEQAEQQQKMSMYW